MQKRPPRLSMQTGKQPLLAFVQDAVPLLPLAFLTYRRFAAVLCKRTDPVDSEEQPTAASGAAGAWNEAGATCIACGIGINSQGFSSSAEQRQHFRTDWHRWVDTFQLLSHATAYV